MLGKLVKLTDVFRVKPGVSTKQMFRSSTLSPRLFLRRIPPTSLTSFHHAGYGLVLA